MKVNDGMAQLSIQHPHPWNLTPKDAVQLQQELRRQVVIAPLPETIQRVAGIDVAFPVEGTAQAAVVVLTYPGLQVVEQTSATLPLSYPYIPGLLSFREIPPILAALEKLSILPDIFLVDGQGLAHPRRFGIACHLGVLVDRPTIGCAKSLLVGQHGPLGETVGQTAPILDRDDIVGAAVRMRSRVKPVYVSIGNRVDLASAVRLVLACGRGYRLPEPTRLADQLSKQRPDNGPQIPIVFS